MAKLYFRYGAMNSGKTTLLLQVAHNYEERGMKILLIKPLIDTKGDEKVVSRLGVDRTVDIRLAAEDTIMGKMTENMMRTGGAYKPHAIIVDESQFLTPAQVDELYSITKEYDIPVLCYGLRCDFQMKGFPGATRLLEISDDIEEMKTICECGKKATQNMRFVNGEPAFEGDQVAIDGEDEVTYKSVCGQCYLDLKEKYKAKHM
jgi:thymidine kinase